MLMRCMCFRPVTTGDLENTSDLQSEAVVSPVGPRPVPLQPRVRSVSPADVRRTGSGRVVRQWGEAQAEARSPPKVLGGKTVTVPPSCDKLLGQQGLQSPARRTAERILQPVTAARQPEASRRSKFVQRFKRPFPEDLTENYDPEQLNTSISSVDMQSADNLTPAPCKSILEASAHRLARHTSAKVTETQQMQQFLTAYVAAINGGNQQWADAADVAAMFAADVVLKTHDKQTFHGKTAVLRRLNNGRHFKIDPLHASGWKAALAWTVCYHMKSLLLMQV